MNEESTIFFVRITYICLRISKHSIRINDENFNLCFNVFNYSSLLCRGLLAIHETLHQSSEERQKIMRRDPKVGGVHASVL